MSYEIKRFISGEIELDILFDKDNGCFWLSIKNICVLYKKTRNALMKHITNTIKVTNDVTDYVTDTNRDVIFKRTINHINYYNHELVIEIGEKQSYSITQSFSAWCDSIIGNNEVQSNIIRFDNGNVSLNVKISPEEETVYLSQEQLGILFGTSIPNVSMHINNIYESGELSKEATLKFFLIVQNESGRLVERNIAYYNLDMIISLGYRINTSMGIYFRRWATRVLKQYMLKGYSIDEKRVTVTSENYIKLTNEVASIDNRLKNVEKEINKNNLIDKIFFEDKFFDAREIIEKIVSGASQSIVLFDPYVDIKALSFFKCKANSVSLYIITSSNKTKLNEEDILDFNRDYGNLSISYSEKYHDRYLIIDNETYYHLGSSLNYLGKAFSQMTKIIEEDVVEILKNRIEAIKKTA